MKPFLLPLVSLLVTLLPACSHGSLPGGSKAETGLCWDSVDGVRTRERVLRRPTLTLTLCGGDETASYEAVFRINEGAERTVHHIWSGVTKDLSGELLAFSDYGPITLTGYLVNTTNPTERIGLDVTLWMTYIPSSRGALLLRSGSREEIVSDGTVFHVGESGTLEIRYAPEDTFLPITLTASEGGPLDLTSSRPTNRDGLYSVPFHVLGTGETLLTLLTENGRVQEKERFSVLCQENE